MSAKIMTIRLDNLIKLQFINNYSKDFSKYVSNKSDFIEKETLNMFDNSSQSNRNKVSELYSYLLNALKYSDLFNSNYNFIKDYVELPKCKKILSKLIKINDEYKYLALSMDFSILGSYTYYDEINLDSIYYINLIILYNLNSYKFIDKVEDNNELNKILIDNNNIDYPKYLLKLSKKFSSFVIEINNCIEKLLKNCNTNKDTFFIIMKDKEIYDIINKRKYIFICDYIKNIILYFSIKRYIIKNKIEKDLK